jgi:drug/metabolite transporter (DMT)-like permease
MSAGGMTTGRATLIGFVAVLLWSLLAFLTVQAGPVPPFQLAAMCLAIGALVGGIWTAVAGRGLRALRGVRPVVWVVGIAGIFGYHFFYFTALSNAPAAQASLIAYLWPLLIVVFSGLLPGERLRAGHLVGSVIAFGGTALVLMGPQTESAAGAAAGYAAALACAFIWSTYSVASRRLGEAPTETVTVFCAVSAVLAAGAHLVLETPVWPEGAVAWGAVVAMGLGPVGLAFYVWDVGVKAGNIQLLSTASYAAPLLSTLVLVGAGLADASATLLLSAALIAGGADIAARAGRRTPPPATAKINAGGKAARSLP